LVVAEVGLTVPQVLAPPVPDGATLNLTRSPTTDAPPAVVVTVAVKAWVLLPSAASVAAVGGVPALAGTRVTVFACGVGDVVWSRTPELVPPVADSVAVMVQKPMVPEAV
jgi:hypothetical protein